MTLRRSKQLAVSTKLIKKLLDEQNTMQGILSIVIVNRSFKIEVAITYLHQFLTENLGFFIGKS